MTSRSKRLQRVEHRSGKNTGSDDWQTPPELLKQIRDWRPILLDPATSADNPVGADAFYTEADDGLSRGWYTGATGIVFCNPPYSRARDWLQKASAEYQWHRQEIVMLVACRPCTRYWARYVWGRQEAPAAAVCFIFGRLTFVGADNPAPFESALVYWGPQFTSFREAFTPIGKVIPV